MANDDRGDIVKRLRKELEYQKKERIRSFQRGKKSFTDWVADLLKKLYNVIAVEIIGGIANWLWELFFGKRK